ncbi:hypothetical protein [Nocardiopsis sp. NPDC058789]|uniref:hypothetical protein n=1 Tax=Nocardiopsis sp. NPDC058789 TaxID=3346634 RepID=UPI00366BEFE5
MDTTAERLDALMDRRRLDLGHNWKAIIDDAGVSYQTLGQLRKGRPVADVTVARVEQALRWQPGSIRAILEGGNPTPAPAPAVEPQGPSRAKWDGEIIGPDEPLYDGEELRWRDEAKARIFQLSVRGLTFEAGLAPGSDPADVIDDLRRTLADRVADVSSDLLRRR